MKKKWKIIFGAVLALGIIAFIFLQMSQKINVVVQEVKAEEFIRSFTEEGVVVAKEEREVYALYTARIDKLLVAEGDRVEEGELLALLDDRELTYTLAELEASLSSLEAELSQARENQARAERNYGRILSLYEAEAVAEIEVEEAESQLNQAQAAVAALEAKRKAVAAQRDLIQEQIAEYRIYAPIAGVVTRLEAEERGLATPQIPLLTIIDREGKEVEARVLTRDVQELSIGMPVNLLFKGAAQDWEFPGRVTAIAPYAEASLSSLGLEEERVKVTIAPEIPADAPIDPGYKLDVEFITEVIPQAFVVPKTALFTYEGEDALFVVEGDRARVRQVQTGGETRREVVITTGLAAGDLVILDPETKGLAEGARVSVTRR